MTDDHDRGELDVRVQAPGFLEPRRFRFREDMTVSEAATEAATAFGYRPNTPGFRAPDGLELPETDTLSAAGVRDEELLQLIDTGGGV